MKILLKFIFLLIPFSLFAQYQIEDITVVECTNVKSQQNTGTCWSFATTSFLESEVIRMGKGAVDLSEMYNARMVYTDKALNYVLRQGKANFSQGSLAHDVTNGAGKFGVVPQEVFSGLAGNDSIYNHSELSIAAQGLLDGVIKTGSPTPHWQKAFASILDSYLGKVPETFTWKEKTYTPISFADYLGIKPENYLHFTSFTHHPFYSEFVLEIPDNYSNQQYKNVTIDDLIEITNNALKHGYTVAWDGDVSEKGFSQLQGLAILPVKFDKESSFNNPSKEITVTPENRQANFMNYNTTDDHLMHLVGMAKDQNGNIYYKIKNSWGEAGEYKGFLYMSEAYFKMKVVGITVHKEGIPKSISGKF